MNTPKPIHGELVPFHSAHGLSENPPVPCDFKLGDPVIFTNDAGLKFAHTIRGFSKKVEAFDHGRFVYIFHDTDAWWFPVGPESLSRP